MRLSMCLVCMPHRWAARKRKKMFWEELEDTIRDIPVRKRTWLGIQQGRTLCSLPVK